MSRCLLLLTVAGGLANTTFAQLPPDKALASLKVADGLQVELFAAEPLLINPTSIDIDHLGRVWVCEAVNYRRLAFKRPILREEGDRIVILTDKDGDGKADDSTVFYQGKDLIAPIGICVLAQPAKNRGDKPLGSQFAFQVLVCQSPDILEFWDKDGDGKADGPPKKFLTGFRGFDHDHGVHGINIGPDGKLYFTVGDSGVDGLQSADGKGPKFKSNTTDIRAGTVWRCDIDGKNLELIAHNFRNNYECCVNSFGEIWLSDNDDDGNQQTRICHVMPGGNYGYHPRGKGESHWHEEQPGIVHKAMRTGFGSPTGICFYEGTLLPSKYHGQLLHTDAGPRELRAFHIKPKGAGYELEKENLVTSTDNWFRLSDVCVAPDGSVMIADWYDPGVGGHGMGDWKMGRIYRVTPKGHKGYKVAGVGLDSMTDLFKAIRSPCQAARSLVQAKLRERGTQNIKSFLRDHDAEKATIAWTRLYAFYPHTFSPEDVFWDVAVSPFVDRYPESLRALSLRSMASLRSVGHPAQWKAFQKGDRESGSLNHFFTSPVIDREYLLMVRHYDDPSAAIPPFYAIAKKCDGQDHFYRAALNIACGTDPKRREAILADFDKQFPDWNDKVADLVWELRPASSLARVGKLFDDAKLTAAQKGRLVDILAVYDDPDAGKTMLSILTRDVSPEIKARAVENLATFLPNKWKELQSGEEVRQVISKYLQSKDEKLAGLKLAAAAPDCTQQGDLEDLAKDDKENREVRTKAVMVIGKVHHAKYFNVLEKMVDDKVIGTTAVMAMGDFMSAPGDNSGAKQAQALLRKFIVDPKTSDELRKAALNSLVATRQGSALLLQIKEKNEMPDSLVADAGKLLRNSPFQGERNKAMLLFPAAAKLDLKKLPPPSVLAQRAGNAARGDAVFKASMKSEAQCMRCHMLRGVGGNIGPDLSMIGKKGSKENLYDSLLTPSKAIADQYLQWKVNTLDEKSVIGLLVEESAASLTLRDANGKDHVIATKDLDGPKQKSLVSIMPDNLVAALTEDELIDLVEYMMTLKTASISPERWYIVGPFPGGNKNIGLDTDHGPIKRPFDVKDTFEQTMGGNVLQWRKISPSGTGYIDLASHYGDAAQNSVSYLYCEIESPVDQDGTMLLGSDDGVQMFVNGEKRLTEKVTRAAAPEQSKTAVKLTKGKNKILIQIANGDNPHGLYIALTSGEELKLVK